MPKTKEKLYLYEKRGAAQPAKRVPSLPSAVFSDSESDSRLPSGKEASEAEVSESSASEMAAAVSSGESPEGRVVQAPLPQPYCAS